MWTVVKNGVIGCKICVKKGSLNRQRISADILEPPPPGRNFIGSDYEVVALMVDADSGQLSLEWLRHLQGPLKTNKVDYFYYFF